MTNVSKTPAKLTTRTRLFQAAVEALQAQGWKVERIQGAGKASVRRITRGNESLKASIRTSQDTWIAFPRDRKDAGWVTLDDVDVVIAASVDSPAEPRFAQVHMLDAGDVRRRFDRAYRARLDAGHKVQRGRGIWISLYREEAREPVWNVGAGAGLSDPPFAQIPLDAGGGAPRIPPAGGSIVPAMDDDKPLTIAQAKQRLARSLGVDPGNIKITVEA